MPPPPVLPLTPYVLATLTFEVLELTEFFSCFRTFMCIIPASWKVLSNSLWLASSYSWFKSQIICPVFRETFLDSHKNRSLPVSLSHDTCSFPQYDHNVWLYIYMSSASPARFQVPWWQEWILFCFLLYPSLYSLTYNGSSVNFLKN